MLGCQRVSTGDSRNETLRASREPWWGGEAGGPALSVRGETGSWGALGTRVGGRDYPKKDLVTWRAVFTKAGTADPPSPGPSVPSSPNPTPPPTDREPSRSTRDERGPWMHPQFSALERGASVIDSLSRSLFLPLTPEPRPCEASVLQMGWMVGAPQGPSRVTGSPAPGHMCRAAHPPTGAAPRPHHQRPGPRCTLRGSLPLERAPMWRPPWPHNAGSATASEPEPEGLGVRKHVLLLFGGDTEVRGGEGPSCL